MNKFWKICQLFISLTYLEKVSKIDLSDYVTLTFMFFITASCFNFCKKSFAFTLIMYVSLYRLSPVYVPSRTLFWRGHRFGTSSNDFTTFDINKESLSLMLAPDS